MIGVLGAGESGMGAALLAKKKGLEVLLSDSGSIREEIRKECILHKIPFEEKGHTIDKLVKAEKVIKSPGIPQEADVIVRI